MKFGGFTSPKSFLRKNIYTDLLVSTQYEVVNSVNNSPWVVLGEFNETIEITCPKKEYPKRCIAIVVPLSSYMPPWHPN